MRLSIWWGTEEGRDYSMKRSIELSRPGSKQFYTFAWRNMVGESGKNYLFAVLDWIKRSIAYLFIGESK